MSNYYKNDLDFARDLEAAYDVIGLPEWWNDTEESDIKLVALYRAQKIQKLEQFEIIKLLCLKGATIKER
jgi:hypothetical protein